MQAGAVPGVHTAPQELQSLLRRSGQQYYADARLVSRSTQNCLSSSTPCWHAVLLHVAWVSQHSFAPVCRSCTRRAAVASLAAEKLAARRQEAAAPRSTPSPWSYCLAGSGRQPTGLHFALDRLASAEAGKFTGEQTIRPPVSCKLTNACRKGDLWAISNNRQLEGPSGPASTSYTVVVQSCWHGPNADGR